MKSAKKQLWAFTIVELMVVIVVIGILATITAVSYGGWRQSVVESQIKSDLVAASAAMESYRSFNGSYPATLPSTFKASSGVTVQQPFIWSNSSGYDLYAASSTDRSITYSVSSTNSTPQKSGALSNGLVLNLDAGNVASYPGNGTTWTDLSGNGNSATINGAVYDAANGGAMRFDGVDDYADAGNKASLNMTSEVTIGAWIKQSTVGASYQGVVGKNSSYWDLENGYGIRQTNAAGTLQVWEGYGVRAENNSLSVSCAMNEWCYVALTYKSGVGGKVWKNGSSVGVLPNKNNIVLATSNFRIGQIESSAYFSGYVSAVHVYNRALSDTEVQQNFNSSCGRYGICI